MTRPRVFIGSSVESKAIAEAFADNIDRDFEPTVWTDGAFLAGETNLRNLLNIAENKEYAVIVLGKDDTTTSRGEQKSSPRDNAIFELGLFMGLLSPRQVFFLIPRHRNDLKLPSDLAGITPLEFDSERTDGNLRSATGAAGRSFKEAISKISGQIESVDFLAVYKAARGPIDGGEF